MKRKIYLHLVITCFLIFSVSKSTAESKFKIAYLEIGEYYAYAETMKQIKSCLKQKDWEAKVEFPADLNFSPGWDNKKGLEEKAKYLMDDRQDVALIIAAGSDATQTLLKFNNKKTPIIGIAVADPVKSKFVISEQDSGVDNFTTRIIPERYKRMFRIFYDTVKFKKLGVLYDSTENSKAFTNVLDAYDVAKEKGFQVIEYNKISSVNKTEECLTGIQGLIDQGIDAFFLSSLNCMDWKQSDVRQIINILIKHKIPTFAREGTRDVKAGALMGFASFDFPQRGVFHGEQIIKILQGTKPRTLKMVNEIKPLISLNLLVAKEIGIDISSDLIISSDEMFNDIQYPEDRKFK